MFNIFRKWYATPSNAGSKAIMFNIFKWLYPEIHIDCDVVRSKEQPKGYIRFSKLPKNFKDWFINKNCKTFTIEYLDKECWWRIL